LDLVALLALIEVPSGDAKSCQQNEEFVSPYIPKRDSSKNRSAQREHRGGKKIQPLVTPALAARRASEDYQSTLDAMGGPTWPNIIEASSRACHWLGIAQKVWGEACMALGRERAALCVLIIDRNRRLPSNHRYHRKFACASLEGMVRKGAHNLNLIGFLRAMEGYPEGLCGKAAPLPRASQPCHQKGVHTVGRFVPVLMAKMQIVVEESKPC
jgi:replication initiation protein RepC